MSKKRKSARAFTVEINGKTKSLSEWAEVVGISRQAMSLRYQKGLRGEELLKPANPSPKGTGRNYSFMVGEQYGLLRVVSIDGYFATVVCDCGTEKRMAVYSILSGNSRSCGCQRGRKRKG